MTRKDFNILGAMVMSVGVALLVANMFAPEYLELVSMIAMTCIGYGLGTILTINNQ